MAMHLYLKYQSLNTFGSKDIAQVKLFKTRSKFKIKVTRSNVLVHNKRSFSVTLDQIQRVFIFSKIESIGGFPLKGGKITSLHTSEKFYSGK
jgi:hypothetical protein